MTLMSIEQAGAFARMSCGVSVCDMVRLLGWPPWVTQWGTLGTGQLTQSGAAAGLRWTPPCGCLSSC